MLRVVSNNIDSVDRETEGVLDELSETWDQVEYGSPTYVKQNYDSIFMHTEEASQSIDMNLGSIKVCIEKLEKIKDKWDDCTIINKDIRPKANEKKMSASALEDLSLKTVQTNWDVDKLQGKDLESVVNVRSALEEKGMRSKEGPGSINDLKKRNITSGGKRKRHKKTKKRHSSKKIYK